MRLGARLRAVGRLSPSFPTPSYYTRTLLTTPTYDASGEGTHPDVLKLHWLGHAYWMAFTPLSYLNDEDTERPSVLVSNNGTTWAAPSGLTNPVVNVGFQTDTELVFHDGTLHLFWRDTAGGDTIKLRTSTDGVTWTAAVTCLSGAGTTLLSPAVIRERDGTWVMWTVNMTASPNTLRRSTATAPEGPWSAPSTLTLVDPEGRDLWHVDVVRDGKHLRAFMQTCSLGNSGDHGRMLLGTSVDGIAWALSAAVLSPAGSGFDDYSVYRQSGFYEQGRWRVWYGAQATTSRWRIGYTEARTIDFPAAPE